MEVKAPRVRDVPAEVSANGSESKIVRRYERTSRQTLDLFRKLYMEGLSTGGFEPVFVSPRRSTSKSGTYRSIRPLPRFVCVKVMKCRNSEWVSGAA